MMSTSVRTPPSRSADASGDASGTWTGRLSLHIARRAEKSTIVARRHQGPYLVQRPFHPEADGTCHVLLIHPPGGLVTGDALELDLLVDEGARALITAPAATKIYRARTSGAAVRQDNMLTVRSGAQLEWLPQETIVFEGARAALHTRVELARAACFIGWEITCLGRPAADEGFARGELTQRWEVRREGRLLWVERYAIAGASPLLTAEFGLRAQPVLGTCLFATSCPEHTEAWVEEARERLAGLTVRGLASLSARGELVIARYLGPSSEEARSVFSAAWQALRPHVLDKPAVSPRIWRT
jgi:urease accessory protein